MNHFSTPLGHTALLTLGTVFPRSLSISKEFEWARELTARVPKLLDKGEYAEAKWAVDRIRRLRSPKDWEDSANARRLGRRDGYWRHIEQLSSRNAADIRGRRRAMCKKLLGWLDRRIASSMPTELRHDPLELARVIWNGELYVSAPDFHSYLDEGPQVRFGGAMSNGAYAVTASNLGKEDDAAACAWCVANRLMQAHDLEDRTLEKMITAAIVECWRAHQSSTTAAEDVCEAAQ